MCAKLSSMSPFTYNVGLVAHYGIAIIISFSGIQIIRVVPLSTLIIVDWTYPLEAEDSIRSYSIFAEYLRPCINVPSSGYIIRDGRARSHFLGSSFVIVRPGTEYDIHMTAFASEGSTCSPPVRVRTLPEGNFTKNSAGHVETLKLVMVLRSQTTT